MPECIKCLSYDPITQSCRSKGKSPVRKCVNTIIRSIVKGIKRKTVLEVGCGKSRFFRRKARRNKGIIYSIDPRKGSHPTHLGLIKDVPKLFDKDFFDIIYAGQTMEHWGNNEQIIENIKALYYVLKPNGYLYINVPIFSHGNSMFVYYNEQEILNCLNICAWELQLEKWRYNYQPLPPYNVKHKIYEKVSQTSKQTIPSIWILEITAKKKDIE